MARFEPKNISLWNSEKKKGRKMEATKSLIKKEKKGRPTAIGRRKKEVENRNLLVIKIENVLDKLLL